MDFDSEISPTAQAIKVILITIFKREILVNIFLNLFESDMLYSQRKYDPDEVKSNVFSEQFHTLQVDI